MASINKVFILGNLGSDPELATTSTGRSVANFNVATNESWTDKQGERRERTEWHKIVVWGKQAEFCKEYLSKGRTVFIEGRIQTRSWEDKEGQKRYTTEIVANNVQFVGGSGGSGGSGRGQARSEGPNTLVEPAGAAAATPPAIADDDVPF
ncbi:MAG: single-stranded DNA-binding protein [Deltaproteobacteria bacterium]|nr:single-stranded DNA-binding protein [Deltaproteobacteria bacterium]